MAPRNLEMMPMRHDVFLSHDSDDKPTVRKLRATLKKRGVRVWLDEDELRPGQRWIHGLEEALDRAPRSRRFSTSAKPSRMRMRRA